MVSIDLLNSVHARTHAHTGDPVIRDTITINN